MTRASDFASHALAAPVAVRLIDIDHGIADIALAGRAHSDAYRWLFCIARIGGDPVGAVTLPVPSSQTVSAEEVDSALWAQLAPALKRRGQSPLDPSTATRAAKRSAPGITVVIATCGQADSAVACVRSLLAAAMAPEEIIVVENRPLRSNTEQSLRAAFGEDTRLRYIEEPEPGLSRARNAGLHAAAQPIVAFLDDDVVVDGDWLDRLCTTFETAPEAVCVTGLILPFDLETREQLTFEQFARFGSRFERRDYRIDQPPHDDPLFPFTPGNFGSGGNMAFRTQALLSVGAYDTSLGAGTPARGGEELDVFLRLLAGGATLVYQPAAIVWHRHPQGEIELRRKVFSYGIGLGATLGKHLARGPNRTEFLRRVPRGVRYLLDPRSAKNRQKGPDFPRRLAWRERMGMLLGPPAYCASLWFGHRLSTTSQTATRPRPRWPMTAHQRATSDFGMIALGLIALLVNAVGLPGIVRVVVTLLAALLLPGWAILTRFNADRLLTLLVVAISLSLVVDTALSLLLVWTSLWIPVAAAIALDAACLGAIAYDARRYRATGAGHARTALRQRLTGLESRLFGVESSQE